MEEVHSLAAEFLKNFVSKTDFITLYNFAVHRGIETLKTFITSTLIRPEEVGHV
jgi:hypothetical protein